MSIITGDSASCTDSLYDVPRDSTVITRDATALSVREFGREDARITLVLLHGFCLDKSAWEVQVRQLLSVYGTDIRIILYDHRGHGDSESAPARTYSIDTLSEDLSDVITTLRVSGTLILAGHSMGGMTAMTYAALPEGEQAVSPDSLVLVATASGRIHERGLGLLLSGVPSSFLTAVAEHFPESVLTPAVKALTVPLARVLIRYFGYGYDADDALEVLSAGSIARTAMSTKAGFLRAFKRFDQQARLGSIRAMTTVISGEKDWLTPPEHSHEMAAAIPASVHLHCESAGHMLLHEAAELVTTVLCHAVDRAREKAQSTPSEPSRSC